jgi:hypothetical protein
LPTGALLDDAQHAGAKDAYGFPGCEDDTATGANARFQVSAKLIRAYSTGFTNALHLTVTINRI